MVSEAMDMLYDHCPWQHKENAIPILEYEPNERVVIINMRS